MSHKFRFQISETESHLLYRFGTHAYQILLFNIHLNPQNTLYFCQGLVYLMIKSLALLEIGSEQFGRWQDLLVFFRELTQVEVAIRIYQLLHRIATRFLVTISNDDFLAVVPPLSDWVAFLGTFFSERPCPLCIPRSWK